MTDTIQNTDKPSRRRQADRVADTRRRIIDATISCLHKFGYATVTISLVAEEAGVSRGIISYHFASKTDLMVAVRETVYRDERQILEETRARIGTREYLKQLPRYVVAGMRREAAMAVNEILLASRADSELIAKLRATEHEIDQRAISELEAYYAELGVEVPTNLAIVMRAWVAAFRGLAITELVQGEEADVEACIDYLSAVFRQVFKDAPVDAGAASIAKSDSYP